MREGAALIVAHQVFDRLHHVYLKKEAGIRGKFGAAGAGRHESRSISHHDRCSNDQARAGRYAFGGEQHAEALLLEPRFLSVTIAEALRSQASTRRRNLRSAPAAPGERRHADDRGAEAHV
jgi:hypothetical protein